jgi:arylsulfatase
MWPQFPRSSTFGLTRRRYDIFMNNFTERTWMGVVMEQELQRIMATYIKYPPRKVQSYGYTGPITLSGYQRFQWVREQLEKEGVHLALPTGN